MNTQQLIDVLRDLRLPGIVDALEQQLQQPNTYSELSFTERLALLVNNEKTARHNKKIIRLIKQAKFRLNASLNDVDYSPKRGLRKDVIAQLSQPDWISQHRNLLIEGATGTGKTFLANAIGRHCCEQGFSVRYYRTRRLFDAMAIAHGDGSYRRLLTHLAKTDLLIIDDWGLEPMKAAQRYDLLEIMEDRHGNSATLIASQLAPTHWHDVIGDPTLADAILDRLLHNAHKLKLEGDSMRKKQALVDLA